MTRIHFFATRSDMQLVFGQMQTKRRLKFTRCGRIDNAEPQVWEFVDDLPNLGRATGDQSVTCDCFLILEWNSSISVDSMIMQDGVRRYDIDQRSNPESVVLNPGGEWTDGSLIAGLIATMWQTSTSQSLMRLARSAIKAHFTRINAFWVGPEVLTAFQKGTRLCVAIQSPSEFDLRISPKK